MHVIFRSGDALGNSIKLKESCSSLGISVIDLRVRYITHHLIFVAHLSIVE